MEESLSWLDRSLQVMDEEYWPGVPKCERTAVRLVQDLKAGDSAVLMVVPRLRWLCPVHKTSLVEPDVLMALVQQVLHPESRQQEQPPPDTSLTLNNAADPYSSSRGNSNAFWLSAVALLALLWPAKCHLLDAATVRQVLQEVLQTLQQQQQQQQQPQQQQQQQQQPEQGHFKRGIKIERTPELNIRTVRDLLWGLLPHSHLVTAVLLDQPLMALATGAVAAGKSPQLAKAVGDLVQCGGVPLAQLPMLHAALCQQLAAGDIAGGNLLSEPWEPAPPPPAAAAAAAVAVRCDPALQAACLKGARRAAAAVAMMANHGMADSGPPAAAAAEVAATAAALPPAAAEAVSCHPAAWMEKPPGSTLSKTCHGYVAQLVYMAEGQLPAGGAPGAGHNAGDLLTCAWQCAQQLWRSAGLGADSYIKLNTWQDLFIWDVLKSLLCSAAARQVLLQQPGGVCRLEEVCGVMGQAWRVRCSLDALEAVKGLFQDQPVREAALAVPGFAAAVVTGVLGADIEDYDPSEDPHPLAHQAQQNEVVLQHLVSDVHGRAALLAEQEALRYMAGYTLDGGDVYAADCDAVTTPHLTQLWAADEGAAEAMLAGLAAGEEGWARFLAWVQKARPVGEWCQLPGLPGAIAAAFHLHQPKHYTTPLERVFSGLLAVEEGRQLLVGHPEVAAAVSDWLVRHAGPGRHSPLVAYMHRRSS